VDYGAALEMRFGATRRGFESRPLRHPVHRSDADACAGQAVCTVEEWVGEPGELEGRSNAPDREAYDRSTERLHALEPARVYFGHDRRSWRRPSA
jgi:hypothetical protein